MHVCADLGAIEVDKKQVCGVQAARGGQAEVVGVLGHRQEVLCNRLRGRGLEAAQRRHRGPLVPSRPRARTKVASVQRQGAGERQEAGIAPSLHRDATRARAAGSATEKQDGRGCGVGTK